MWRRGAVAWLQNATCFAQLPLPMMQPSLIFFWQVLHAILSTWIRACLDWEMIARAVWSMHVIDTDRITAGEW